MCLEAIRRGQREYEARWNGEDCVAPSVFAARRARKSTSASVAEGDEGKIVVTQTGLPVSEQAQPPHMRINRRLFVKRLLIRSILRTIQYLVAYLLMLEVMSFNGMSSRLCRHCLDFTR